jgi:hypothetical protein
MKALFKALIVTGLTSLAGYAFRTYRERKAREQRESNKLALQQWDTDGGGNPQHQYARPAASARSSA